MKETLTIDTLRQLPEAVFITGQSGSGKGLLFHTIKQLYAAHDIEQPLFIGVGASFRKGIESGTTINERIAVTLNQGQRAPSFIAGCKWYHELETSFVSGTAFIDGSPRSKEEVALIAECVDAGIIKSAAIIEIVALPHQCERRLHARTLEDKRPDLWDEVLEQPSATKIRQKMRWWTASRIGIQKRCAKHSIPYSIAKNTNSTDYAREQIIAALQSIAIR